jgi:hypothetical protein
VADDRTFVANAAVGFQLATTCSSPGISLRSLHWLGSLFVVVTVRLSFLCAVSAKIMSLGTSDIVCSGDSPVARLRWRIGVDFARLLCHMLAARYAVQETII